MLIVVAILVVLSAAQPPCKFADQFTKQQLLENPVAREALFDAIHYWEGQFGKVGYNHATGHTYDGHGIDYTSGQLDVPLHNFSAPSKECMQVMMLTLALNGVAHAQRFVSPDDPKGFDAIALEILQNKITTYEKWDQTYPGYGGYLPWVSVNDSGIAPQGDYWATAVPALDNGENIWAIVALVHVLSSKASSCHPQDPYCKMYASLRDRYSAYLAKLAKNAYTIFYHGSGYVRAVATIKNIYAQPTPDNYGDGGVDYYLDDPYEGELFVWFLDLFGTWPDPNEREQVWINKRAKLQPVDLPTPNGPITVQKGWVYSSHEMWKFLEMPYLDIPISRRVFTNGERARAWNSVIRNVPGMHATVSNVTSGGPVTQYLNSGIPWLSYVTNSSDYDLRLITPYSTFPLFLINQTTALLWYFNFLQGPRMQGPYGSTESTYSTGTMISPVLTWDSKITTLVGMNGGVGDIVRSSLIESGKYARFIEIINREWTLAFPSLKGENLDIPLPSLSIPLMMNPNYFTTCPPNKNN